VNFSIKMDFFDDEGLPEHIVLHVMEYLDNRSLLELAKCNNRLKKLFGSKKIANRFSLRFKFMDKRYDEPIRIAEIEAIHQRIASSGRKYKILSVENFSKAIKRSNEDLRPAAFDLLRMLGKCVIEVLIDENYAYGNVNDFLQFLMSFPNATKYTLNYCRPDFTDGGVELAQRLRNGELEFMKIVEELHINTFHGIILKAFSSCSKVKRFTLTNACTFQSGRIQNEFLNRQTQLEHLKIGYTISIDFADWLMFNFRLKSLDIVCKKVEYNAAHLFFEQQNKLELLRILIRYDVYEDAVQAERERVKLYNTIESIWRLPKLKNLEIDFGHFNYRQQPGLPETFFDGLPRNNTIQSITVKEPCKNVVRLFNFMDAVKEIEIHDTASHLNLSDLRLDVIAKITVFSEDQLIYSPEEVPENRVEFERIFDQLLQPKYLFLKAICIGHPSWLRHQDEFQLSFEFCKNLMNAVPKLKQLKLYSVHPDFAAYLDANKPKSLESIELHATNSESKRMRLNSD